MQTKFYHAIGTNFSVRRNKGNHYASWIRCNTCNKFVSIKKWARENHCQHCKELWFTPDE